MIKKITATLICSCFLACAAFGASVELKVLKIYNSGKLICQDTQSDTIFLIPNAGKGSFSRGKTYRSTLEDTGDYLLFDNKGDAYYYHILETETSTEATPTTENANEEIASQTIVDATPEHRTTLLHTVDQNLNTNLALGGNPAILAHNKTAEFQLGSMLAADIKQSTSILTEERLAANVSSKATDGPTVYDGDRYARLVMRLDDDEWFGITYSKGLALTKHISATLEETPAFGIAANTYKYRSTITELTERYSFTYSRTMVPGIFCGLQADSTMIIANNYFKPNSALVNLYRDNGMTLRTQDISSETSSFGSITLGSLFTITKALRLSASYKMHYPFNMIQHGKTMYDVGIYQSFSDMRIPNETALSLLFDLSDNIELGIGSIMYATTPFTMLYDDKHDTKPNENVEVQWRGYTSYAIFSQLRLTNSIALQSFFSWAKDAKQYNSSTEMFYNPPVDITYSGMNITGTFGQHMVALAIDHYNSIGIEAKNSIDQYKTYLNYGYTF